MNYRIHSRDYMQRARMRLDNGSFEALFYAAFELRCGIEARMQEYLEAQDHISNNMKKGWQIAQLAKNIEKVFKSGNKIVKYALLDKETGETRFVLFYTPVNAKLQKMGEQLGDYLHAMKVYRPEDDLWWKRTHSFLEVVMVELQKANFGSLLGTPLLNVDTGQVNMSIEPTNDGRIDELMEQFGKPGTEIVVEVSYLDEFPNESLKGT